MKGSSKQSRLTLRVIALVMATAALVLGGCVAQNAHHEAGPAPTMTAPVLTLYNQGRAAVQAGELQRARERYQAALQQARALEDGVGIGASLAALGAMYAASQEYPEALEFLSAALLYTKSLTAEWSLKFMETRGIPAQMRTNLKAIAAQGIILMGIGVIHTQMGNDASALEAFDRGLAVGETTLREGSAQEKPDISSFRATVLYLTAAAHERLGQAHERLGQWTQAVDSYRQAAAAFQQLGDRKGAGVALWGAGDVASQKIGAPQQAIELYMAAWPLLQEVGEMANGAQVGWSLMSSYIAAGDVQQAVGIFPRVVKLAERAGLANLVVTGYAQLGRAFEALGKYEQALRYFQAELQRLRAGDWKVIPGLEPAILLDIGKMHAQLGNDASAMETFNRALAIGEKLLERVPEQEKTPILTDRGEIFFLKAGIYEKSGQWAEAVDSYRRAAADHQKVGNRARAGAVLMKAGDVARQKMGALQQAIELYTEAASLLQQAGEIGAATWARWWLGMSHLETGHVQEAAAVFTEVIKIAEREGFSAQIVSGYFGLGLTFEAQAEFEQALTHHQAALQRLRAGEWKGEPSMEPRLLANMGKVHRVLGQYEEAIEYFRGAAVRYREVQDATGEAEALTQLAEVFFWLVDHKTAIQYYKQALEIYKKSGNLPKQIEMLAALGEAGSLSGEMLGKEVNEYFEAGGKLAAAFQGMPRGDFYNLWVEAGRGKALSEEEHKRLYEEWLKAVPSLSREYRMAAGALYQKWGRVFLEGRNLDGAVSMLASALVYHAILPADRDTTIEVAKDGYFLGEAYRQKGDFDKALQAFGAVEGGVRRLRTPEIHWVYAGLARTYADLGNVDEAVGYYRKALETLESVQSLQGTDESKMDVLAGALYAYRGFVTLLLDLHRTTKEERYLHEAFQVTERLRARAFLDMVGKSRTARLGGDVGGLTTKVEELRRQIGRIHYRLRSPKLDSAEETSLLDQLDHLRESWRSLQREAAQQSPRYAQIASPRPVTVEEVQSIVDADTALLEYSIGPERSTLWVITNDEVHVYSLPGQEGVPVFEQYLKTVRGPLMGSEEVSQHVALGQEVYQTLVGPAEGHIRGKKHLIIVPDGPLYYLPFEALILPDSQKGARKSNMLADARYLVKQFRVSYVPSASVLVTQRKERGRRGPMARLPLLAFGDPVYREATSSGGPDIPEEQIAHLRLREVRLSRLEFSGDEVRRIARMWGIPPTSPHINLRDRASVGRVHEMDLSQYRILHFATHAVLGDEVRWATQPALVLSQKRGGENTDGLLPFADILDLKLNADLVVLSACDTGLGRLREGEGIVGLTRAFLYAGASTVVVSLWNVEDQSTSLLMERFYRHMKQGASKAEALRQAKLEVLKATIDLKAIGARQALASPFYWAPFIVVGDWD